MKKAGIYKITNLINGKIYIGSTSNINERSGNHFRQLKNNKHKCRHLQNAYNVYGFECFKFDVLEEVIDNKTIEFKLHLEQLEQYYLDTLLYANINDNRFHNLGYNHRRVASNNTGIKFDPSATKNMGRKKGFKKTFEQIEANRKILTGKKRSDETKMKLSIALKRVRNDPEMRSKRKKLVHTKEQLEIASKRYSKEVMQFDFQGNFITKYKSVVSCQKITGYKGISLACTGKYKHAHNFIWIYSNDFSDSVLKDKISKALFKKLPTNTRAVYQIDIVTGNIINEFESCADASRKLGKIGNNISSCCLGKLKYCYGFKWQFVDKNT